jgi:putative pyruvate formate lyase activating enzyme
MIRHRPPGERPPARSAGERVPGYVALYRSGELERRADAAVAALASCRVCPWLCDVNRLGGEERICHTARHARVSSYFPHHGEEDCLRGWNGSGTIFFSRCNLRCVFCQNFDLSQRGSGAELPPERIAGFMLELQIGGCHNINLVTPEHVVPQVLEALVIAIGDGLRIPIVYNTSGFDSLESLRSLDGIVDIYMPDFKLWTVEASRRYLKCPAYPEAARAAFREMHRQVGDLIVGPDGLAERGLLVRHLLMPGMMGEPGEILRFLAEEISPNTYLNLMDQYHPAGRVGPGNYAEIDRRITGDELAAAYRIARERGLHRFDAEPLPA